MGLRPGIHSTSCLTGTYIGSEYDNVKKVSDNIEDVKSVASAIGEDFPGDGLDTIAENIEGIKTVSEITNEVVTIAGINDEVVTVSSIKDEVVSVASNIGDVVLVAPIIGEVDTVAGIKDEVVTVAGIEQEIRDVPSYTTQAIDAAASAEEDAIIATNGAVRSEQGADRAEAAAESVKPYVDGALSDLSTAANKFYPTLALANADIDNIMVNQPIHVGEADNGGLWYKATSGATTLIKSAYDPVSSANQFSVYKVESLKDSLIVTSKNLFNASSATLDKYIGADGVIVSSSTYHISDFIPVDSGEYTMSAETGVAESFRSANFYGKNKNFLRQSVYSGGSNPRTITISPDTYFVRFNMRLGAPQELKRMFNKGAVALPYEAYKKELRDVTFSNKQLVDIKDSLDIKDTAKPYFKNEDSYNLYNYMNVVEGYGVNNTTGELEVDADYFTTEFIPVKPSTKYGISNELGVNGFNKTAYYDENKQFIEYINSPTKSDGFYAWTTPVNARFVRLASNYLYPSAYKRMFVEGDVPLDYKSGVPELAGVKLSDEIVAQIGEIVAPSVKNLPYVYDRDLNEIFSLSAGYTGYTDWNSRTAAQVYALYDELADNNSDYITKHDMQLDLLGNEIAYYKLSPAKPTIGQESRLPVVVLNVGIHGHEKAATLSTYLFIKLLCEGWRDDPVLEAMRFGVVFYILPISNPSGWNTNTRKNPNGVDLNRNFPYKWDNQLPPENEKYGGASAASEIETQNIMAMLADAGDIDIFYDHHNFQKSIDRYLWVSIGGADNRLLERMSQSFISRMTNKWRKEYDWIPQDESWFAGYSDTASSPSSGILSNYVRFEVGVLASATFEVCDNWTVNRGLTKYGVELTKTGVEALVNWLAINLVNLNHYRG